MNAKIIFENSKGISVLRQTCEKAIAENVKEKIRTPCANKGNRSFWYCHNRFNSDRVISTYLLRPNF